MVKGGPGEREAVGVHGCCEAPKFAKHAGDCVNATAEAGEVHLVEKTGEAREVSDEALRAHADSLVESFEDEMERRYDFQMDSESSAFHQVTHVREARYRGRRIREACRRGGMELSVEDDVLSDIAIAGHDLLQEFDVQTENEKWSADDRKYGRKFRKRHTGANEDATGVRIAEFMRRRNAIVDEIVFPEPGIARVQGGVEGTEPDPRRWKELGTVYQPRAEHSRDIVVITAALADLGEAGMEVPEKYLAGGDNLFIEENIDMWDLAVDELDDDAREYYRARMMDWVYGQIGFAEGRKKRLEVETQHLPDGAREEVRDLFYRDGGEPGERVSRFDDTIEAARERAAQRELMSFEDLYADMGFVSREQTNRETDAANEAFEARREEQIRRAREAASLEGEADAA